MIIRLLMSLAVCLLTASVAGAQIKTDTVLRYNTAVAGNDRGERIAAAQKLAKEAMTSPQNDQAALLAYEAAFTLCQNGACRKAIKPARFAAGLPATHTHPTQPDRDLLLAYVAWKSDPGGEARKALDSALARVDGTDLSLLRVTAFQERYLADLDAEAFDRAEISARAAAAHFLPHREKIGAIWADAEIASHASSFNERSDPQAMIGMAQLSVYLNRESYVLGGAPAWMEDRYYQAEAWRLAMEAYFISVGEAEDERAYADKISKDTNVYFHPLYESAMAPPPGTDLRPCDGAFSRTPSPSYPRNAAALGQFGSVIVALDIDETGKIAARIGASVPNDRFDSAVLRSFNRVRWEWKEPAPGEPECVKHNQRAIWPFVFAMG